MSIAVAAMGLARRPPAIPAGTASHASRVLAEMHAMRASKASSST